MATNSGTVGSTQLLSGLFAYKAAISASYCSYSADMLPATKTSSPNLSFRNGIIKFMASAMKGMQQNQTAEQKFLTILQRTAKHLLPFHIALQVNSSLLQGGIYPLICSFRGGKSSTGYFFVLKIVNLGFDLSCFRRNPSYLPSRQLMILLNSIPV